MKKIVIILLGANFIFQGIFAQQLKGQFSDDQKARIKFSVHLINYATPPTFKSPEGEAAYNLINFSFMENQLIPAINLEVLNSEDKAIMVNHISLLEQAKTNTLSWEQLMKLEVQYLNWIDRAQRRNSKYHRE